MDEQDPLDREIEALLGVEPSAGFLPRLRASVDAQPMAARMWLTGRWVAVAACAIALLLVLLTWRAQVAPSPLPRPVERGVAALEPPAPIVIEPITIAPLLTADLELGEQQ